MTEDWKKFKIKDIVEGLFDGPHATPKESNSGPVFLGIQNLTNDGHIDLSEIRHIADEDYSNWTKRVRPKENDIVFTYEATLHRYGLIPEGLKCCLGRRMALLRVNRAIVNPKFLMYYFFSKEWRSVIERNLLVGATVNRIPISKFPEFPVQLPELQEQNAIANILYLLDSKISLNNRINAELEALAKTIYDYWFVQFDFPISKAQAKRMGNPKLEGKPYKASGGKMEWNERLKREVPEGWKVENIETYFNVKDGTHDSPKYTTQGYRLITSKNLKPEGLDFENANLISEEDYSEINKRSKVDTGDILFSMIGNIGTIYKVEEMMINFAVKNVAIFKSSEKLALRNFVYMYLKSQDMNRYMTNTISGSIQKFIGLGDLRRVPFIIENSTIVKYTEITTGIFEKIQNCKLENRKLTELRDWLLPMLMNGQIKIKDAERDPDSYREAMAAEPVVSYQKGSR